jgi:3-oxoadipate enol-lactonase
VLFYEVAGAGPPIVLLHAGGTDATIWDEQVPVLAERFTVVRFDARGHGRSPGGPESFSRVDDLFGVMDAAGVPRATLVGVSQGARVALEAALARPERVSALVLASLAPPGAAVPAEAELLARGEVDAAIEAGQRYWVAGPHRRLEDVDAALRARLAAMDRRAMTGPPLGPERIEPVDPAAVAVPTVVVVGELDRDEVHSHARHLAAAIPGARLEVVAGAGHLVNLERPAAFVALIRAALHAQAPATTGRSRSSSGRRE